MLPWTWNAASLQDTDCIVCEYIRRSRIAVSYGTSVLFFFKATSIILFHNDVLIYFSPALCKDPLFFIPSLTFAVLLRRAIKQVWGVSSLWFAMLSSHVFVFTHCLPLIWVHWHRWKWGCSWNDGAETGVVHPRQVQWVDRCMKSLVDETSEDLKARGYLLATGANKQNLRR